MFTMVIDMKDSTRMIKRMDGVCTIMLPVLAMEASLEMESLVGGELKIIEMESGLKESI